MKRFPIIVLSSLVGFISLVSSVKVLAQQKTVILEPEQSPPIQTTNNLWVRAEAYNPMNHFLKNAITVSLAVRNTAEGTYLGNERENKSIGVEVNCRTGEALAVILTINYIPVFFDQRQKPFNILENPSKPENIALRIACYHYLNSRR